MRYERRHLLRASVLAASSALVLSGCSIFDDPSPHDISVQFSGGEGTPVEVIYSKQFQAGVDESGGTHVQIFLADTVLQVLPVDTVVSVEVEQRIFVQLMPVEADVHLALEAHVRVDGRSVVADSRTVDSANPWRYVYVFNQPVSPIVDVVF